MSFRFLFLLLFFMGACQKVERMKKPANLISDKVMVEVLIDLAKIDAARSIDAEKFDEYGGKRAKQLLFEKYHIDSVQLVQSTAYYAEHLKMNDSIYSRVKRRLKKESDSLLILKNGAPDSE